jgi:predicted nucleic acid-binding protein
MKSVFVDVNVCIDLLSKRNPFYKDAAILFSLADEGFISVSVSSLSFVIIDYILKSHYKASSSRKILSKFKSLINIYSVDDKIIQLALTSAFSDFEDAVQHYAAIENGAEIIVTRNKSDFKNSLIPVLTPAEFLKTIR